MNRPAPPASDAAEPAGAPLRPKGPRSRPVWLGPLIALIVLVGAIVAVELIQRGQWPPAFLRPANLINILHNWSFVGFIALGMTFVIILGGIDLSVGSLVAFAGGLGIVVMNAVIRGTGAETAGVLAAFAAIVAAGAAAGLLNGVLIAKGRVAPFIATLGGLAAYRSLALAMIEGGEFRSESAAAFARLGTEGIPIGFHVFGREVLYSAYGQPLVLPWPVVVFAVAACLAHVLLDRTRYGRYVYAIGCNERAAVYSAVRVGRVKIATYGLLGFLTGVAALMNSSRMNSVSSGQTGLMWELDAIAAVVIGGTQMSGGAGTIFGTVIGLLMLGVIGNMLNLLQVSPYLQGLVKGLIIVAAVLLQRSRRRP